MQSGVSFDGKPAFAFLASLGCGGMANFDFRLDVTKPPALAYVT